MQSKLRHSDQQRKKKKKIRADKSTEPAIYSIDTICRNMLLSRLNELSNEKSLEQATNNKTALLDIFNNQTNDPVNVESVSKRTTLVVEETTIVTNKSANLDRQLVTPIQQPKIVDNFRTNRLFSLTELQKINESLFRSILQLPIFYVLLRQGGYLWGEFLGWLLREIVSNNFKVINRERILAHWQLSILRATLPFTNYSLSQVLQEAFRLQAQVKWLPTYDLVTFADDLDAYRSIFPLKIHNSEFGHLVLPPGHYIISLPANGLTIQQIRLPPQSIFKHLPVINDQPPDAESDTPRKIRPIKRNKSSTHYPSKLVTRLTRKKSKPSSLDKIPGPPEKNKYFTSRNSLTNSQSEIIDSDSIELVDIKEFLPDSFKEKGLIIIYLLHGEVASPLSEYIVNELTFSARGLAPRFSDLTLSTIYSNLLTKNLALYQTPETLESIIMNLIHGYPLYNKGYKLISEQDYASKIKSRTLSTATQLIFSPDLSLLNIWLHRAVLEIRFYQPAPTSSINESDHFRYQEDYSIINKADYSLKFLDSTELNKVINTWLDLFN